MAPDSSAEDDEDLTTKSSVRWTYLGSLLAFVLLSVFMSLVVAAAFGYADLGQVSTGWFYLTWIVIVTATAWVFGPEIVKELLDRKQ